MPELVIPFKRYLGKSLPLSLYPRRDQGVIHPYVHIPIGGRLCQLGTNSLTVSGEKYRILKPVPGSFAHFFSLFLLIAIHFCTLLQVITRIAPF